MGGDGGSDARRSAPVVFNDKYVVFKRDDWSWENVNLTPQDEVKDAVVIRLQDVFAESALWTYANEIRAALEILQLLGIDNDDEHLRRLDEIAEYFCMMADAAGRTGKKVPD